MSEHISFEIQIYKSAFPDPKAVSAEAVVTYIEDESTYIVKESRTKLAYTKDITQDQEASYIMAGECDNVPQERELTVTFLVNGKKAHVNTVNRNIGQNRYPFMIPGIVQAGTKFAPTNKE